MFENLKLKLAARWLKENQVQPRLILSASDKIYLATAKKTIKKLTYIYTLACLPDQDRPGQCKLFPTTQVSTFDNKRHAELYYNTINQIMKLQSTWPSTEFARSVSAEMIVAFKQQTR